MSELVDVYSAEQLQAQAAMEALDRSGSEDEESPDLKHGSPSHRAALRGRSDASGATAQGDFQAAPAAHEKWRIHLKTLARAGCIAKFGLSSTDGDADPSALKTA